MVAVEFCEESTRMCKTYPSCSDCPAKLDDGVCGLRCSRYDYAPDKKVAIVEQWAKEHPRKTRQSEFLKQWPNAKIGSEGTVAIDPCIFDTTVRNRRCIATSCAQCRREFWTKEVE